MPLKKSSSYEKQPTPFEEKGYLARIVQVVDLGLQDQGEFRGEKKEPAFEFMVTFEFPEVRNDKDQPCWVSKRFRLPKGWPDKSSIKNNSNLYKFISAHFPRYLTQAKHPEYAFVDQNVFDAMLDTPAYVEIKLTVNGNPAILSIGKLPSFVKEVPPLENEPLLFVIGQSTVEDWKRLFGWTQRLVIEALDEETSKFGMQLDEQASEDNPVGDAPKEVAKPKTKAKKKEVVEEGFDDDIPF